jgi:hypothetical protein
VIEKAGLRQDKRTDAGCADMNAPGVPLTSCALASLTSRRSRAGTSCSGDPALKVVLVSRECRPDLSPERRVDRAGEGRLSKLPPVANGLAALKLMPVSPLMPLGLLIQGK